jgi:hypothetical protein
MIRIAHKLGWMLAVVGGMACIADTTGYAPWDLLAAARPAEAVAATEPAAASRDVASDASPAADSW